MDQLLMEPEEKKESSSCCQGKVISFSILYAVLFSESRHCLWYTLIPYECTKTEILFDPYICETVKIYVLIHTTV